MTWTTLHLEVTTPLFNAGAEPDDKAGGQPGVRVSSLRGAMRFWFRVLVGGVTGPNLGLLAELEHMVFGDTGRSCPVPLRIPAPPPQVKAGMEQMDRWIVYLLGQGLGDLRASTTIRPYVPPGRKFELKLRLRPLLRGRHDNAGAEQCVDPEVAAALTLASLWLTCTYGGLGARTRRGFGGLRIVGSDGWLPPPWTPEAIQTPDLDHYEGMRFLWPDATVGKCLTTLLKTKGGDTRKAWTSPPSFPVLHRQHTLAGASGGGVFDNWEHTLRHAGEQLRNFRASRDAPGARYSPPRKTPEWEDVIWGPGDRFPLGALGLPVVFKKNGPEVNAEKRGDGVRRGESLRRASPLWLRAVGSDDEWRLFSFAFLGEFLPGSDGPVVNLRNPGKSAERLRVDTADVRRLAEQWINEMARDGSFINTRRQ
ncbi:MAG: type III-B CRISPR module RAMP protein Cmr1 [Pseudonocardiaceae bacterium]